MQVDPIPAALEFMERCRDVCETDAVLRELARSTSLFGLEHFILTSPPSANQVGRSLITSQDWPRQWYDIYASRNYVRVDGLAQWALRTHRPFTYGEVPEALRQPEAARRVRAEAKSFGLADGLVVPVYSGRSRHSVAVFSTSTRCEVGPQDRSALHLIAIHVGSLIHQRLGHPSSSKQLTPREREVLAWTAQGKSAWETSEILAVSERTVAKHLENIRTKLNAATSAQAVAEALRRGEITL